MDWLSFFREAGAVWEYRPDNAHVAFEMAPIHTGFYFNTKIVGQNPDLVKKVAQILAERCIARGVTPDRIIAYVADVADGSIFAGAVAAELGVASGFVDLQNKSLSFQPKAGETAVVIADDIVSGGSLMRSVALLEQQGVKVLSLLLTLADFSGQGQLGGRPIEALFTRKVEGWPSDNCPLCKAGSRPIKARSGWAQLKSGATL